jgi:hypothetical protein
MRERQPAGCFLNPLKEIKLKQVTFLTLFVLMTSVAQAENLGTIQPADQYRGAAACDANADK